MRQGIRWLYGELPRLVERGVLTPDAAEALRHHYGPLDSADAGASWGQILLASFGALLVGGGIILIVAHNWDDLGRPARAALVLAMLAAAQALTIYAAARRPNSIAWREAASAFLVCAVGAAIALVGQTYNVGGSFESLMRAWLWLVVLVPYLTGSNLASILFWALLVVRVGNLGWREGPSDPWLLVFAALPFVVMRLRREPQSWATALLAIASAASIFIVGSIFAGSHGWNGLWAVFQVSFVAAVVAAASWPPGAESLDPWRRRVLVPAWLVLIVVGTILTFDDAWRTVSIVDRDFRRISVILTALVAAACAVFATIITIRLARAGKRAAAAAASAALLVVLLHALAMMDTTGVSEGGWIAFNLWLLALGVLAVIEGLSALELGTTNRGLAALAALIAARFFDTDLNFLARGLAFVAFGLACFAVNIWLMRRVRKRAA
jgi:uncharacterized membrane protein